MRFEHLDILRCYAGERVKYLGSMLTDYHETSIKGILLMKQLK